MARERNRATFDARGETLLVRSALLVALAVACGGKSAGPSAGVSAGSPGSGGSSGASQGGDAGQSGGTGGVGAAGSTSAGNGGTAGESSGTGGSSEGGETSAGVGGTAGESAGTGGMSAAGAAGAGLSGSAGASAGAGGAMTGAECVVDEDCVLFSDCCDCAAEPVGHSRTSCNLGCIEPLCFDLSIGPDDVRCAYGRCVLNRSCDQAHATCFGSPPICPAGAVPIVENNCFGACIPVTECLTVTGCDDCAAAGAVCVENQVLGNFGTGCVTPGGCVNGNLCECLDACQTACAEEDGKVGCYCLGC